MLFEDLRNKKKKNVYTTYIFTSFLSITHLPNERILCFVEVSGLRPHHTEISIPIRSQKKRNVSLVSIYMGERLEMPGIVSLGICRWYNGKYLRRRYPRTGFEFESGFFTPDFIIPRWPVTLGLSPNVDSK